MDARSRDPNAPTLREHLRSATAQAHSVLDAASQSASQWRSTKDYADFLTAQYTARISVELWLSMFAPAELKPPEQTPMLAHDLSNLGRTIPVLHPKFDADFAGEASALGVAWVLAGSSLGNRAMLHEMKQGPHGGANWPHQFLSSHSMTEFWKNLRRQVERPTSREEAEEATRAAQGVFEHFVRGAKAPADLQVQTKARTQAQAQAQARTQPHSDIPALEGTQ